MTLFLTNLSKKEIYFLSQITISPLCVMKQIVLNMRPPKEENKLKCSQHTNSKQLIYSMKQNGQYACRQATPYQLTVKCRHPGNYREKLCLVLREIMRLLHYALPCTYEDKIATL